MKSFEELGREIALIRYLGSEFGTMYFEPNAPREEETIIRHLDNKLTLDLFLVYQELYNSIISWIEDKTKVQKYVFMPPLLEVGKDYFIRRFYVYYISIRNYLGQEWDYDEEWDGYVEPPELYEEMKNAISQELNKEVSVREGIIQKVLKKSLLEPTGKTFYEGRKMNKFIIVEPKISLEDLEEWQNY